MSETNQSGAATGIILVEDDEPIRRRLAALLEAWPSATLLAQCANLAGAEAVIATYAELADRLGLSRQTVPVHVRPAPA